MEYKEFKELIEEFVAENFYPDNICESCSDGGVEIIPDDYGNQNKFDEKLMMIFRKIKPQTIREIIND